MLLALLAQAPSPPFKDWAAAAIVALTPILIAVISWLVDNFKGTIPAWLKPILATALGSALTWLGGIVTGDPILIAIIGLATVGLREVIVRLGQAGTFGSGVKARWAKRPL